MNLEMSRMPPIPVLIPDNKDTPCILALGCFSKHRWFVRYACQRFAELNSPAEIWSNIQLNTQELV